MNKQLLFSTGPFTFSVCTGTLILKSFFETDISAILMLGAIINSMMIMYNIVE